MTGSGHSHADWRFCEEGFTLLEAMIVLVVLAVLLVISVPIVSTLLDTTSRIDHTYANIDGQLSLSTTLQRLLRSAVAPAPPIPGGAPITGERTPFVPGKLTPTSMTFYANTGTASGPVKVSAGCAPLTASHAYLCAPTARFTLTSISPVAGSCPTRTTSSKVCSYPTASARLLLALTHVQDGPHAMPLFEYSYGTQRALGTPITVVAVCVTTTSLPAGCTQTKAPGDSATLGTARCLAAPTNATSPYVTCPAGAVAEVTYDLQLNALTTKAHPTQSTSQRGGLQAESSTGTFVLSATSMLFDPAVG